MLAPAPTLLPTAQLTHKSTGAASMEVSSGQQQERGVPSRADVSTTCPWDAGAGAESQVGAIREKQAFAFTRRDYVP